MAILDRDVCIRNHVMGVLAFHCEKGLDLANLGELADSITEAVIEGDMKWQDDNLCEQMLEMALNEDVPQ